LLTIYTVIVPPRICVIKIFLFIIHKKTKKYSFLYFGLPIFYLFLIFVVYCLNNSFLEGIKRRFYNRLSCGQFFHWDIRCARQALHLNHNTLMLHQSAQLADGHTLLYCLQKLGFSFLFISQNLHSASPFSFFYIIKETINIFKAKVNLL